LSKKTAMNAVSETCVKKILGKKKVSRFWFDGIDIASTTEQNYSIGRGLS
jgi:hypothetical protein